MMRWSESETRQVESELRAALQSVRSIPVRQKKRLAEKLAPVFRTPQGLEAFRRDLARLFSWDTPSNDERDHFELYASSIITGLVALDATPEKLPWLPFLAATSVAHHEEAGFFYGRDGWRALAAEVCSVPVEYLGGVLYDSTNEVMSDTMRSLCVFYATGLEAEFVREVPIRGMELPDYGYTIEQAKRLQDEGIPVNICALTFYRKRKRGRGYSEESEEATEEAIALVRAGVPWLYAHKLFQAGLNPAETIAAHKAGLPVEYAVAASGL